MTVGVAGVLDPDRGQVVVPVAGVPGDVSLGHHLRDPAAAGNDVVSGGLRGRVLEPLVGGREPALRDVDHDPVDIAQAAVARGVVRGRGGLEQHARVVAPEQRNELGADATRAVQCQPVRRRRAARRSQQRVLHLGNGARRRGERRGRRERQCQHTACDTDAWTHRSHGSQASAVRCKPLVRLCGGAVCGDPAHPGWRPRSVTPSPARACGDVDGLAGHRHVAGDVGARRAVSAAAATCATTARRRNHVWATGRVPRACGRWSGGWRWLRAWSR